MFIQALGTASNKVCDVVTKFEPLLNLSRSVKTLTEFMIETPRCIVDAIAWVVNPIFAAFAAVFEFKPIVFTAENLNALEPFAKSVKQLRNGLNFFELPLAVKKFCASWNDAKTSSIKRFSNFITIPQKLMESFLLIPDDFNIFKLDAIAPSWGKWCASKLGDSWAWQLFNRDGLFAVKEVFALQASVTNFFAYGLDYNRLQAKVNDKLQRNTIHLSPLKQMVDDPGAPVAALLPLVAKFNAEAAKRQQNYKNLKELESEVIALHKDAVAPRPQNYTNAKAVENVVIDLQKAKDEKKDALTRRYICRFFLENDATGKPPVIPAELPEPVRQRLETIIRAFPTPQARLKRIFTYKFNKSEQTTKLMKLSKKKDVIGWRYEISKMAIITLGLIKFMLTFNPLSCTLKTVVRATTLSRFEKFIDFDQWCAKFAIGGLGLFRVFYINYKIEPQEIKAKAAMPNAQMVFAL